MIGSCTSTNLQDVRRLNGSSPNFLIILADDLGYGDLGCFGNKIIKTPNLDQLARQGVLYTDCYASAPMCSPSRAGLLTGRVPYRTGIYDWIAPDSLMYLPRNEHTIATLLKEQNYATSLFGKWHLNGSFDPSIQTQPQDHGFDYWYATQYSPDHKDPKGFYRNGKPAEQPEGYSCQIVAHEAANWLKNIRDKGKPFFQFVAFHEPHEPIMSPPALVKQYQKYGIKAEYYANVTNLDNAIGKILKTLEAEGIADNTFVIFTSDNGPAAYTPTGYFNKSHGSAAPLRGYKRHQFEGGIRVPGILRWPKRTKAGTTENTPICNIDFLPTLCHLAGVKLPVDLKIDGTDISPLFVGKEINRPTPLHWHFYDPWGGPQSLLRTDKWILGATWDVGDFHKKGRFYPAEELPIIKKSRLAEFSLYNIRNDLHQDQDIAKQYPEVVRDLSRQLIQLHQDVMQEAPLPQELKTPK
ncbi:MAG: arylsulfatase [Saprospiraceae bacterium]|nr:MAG: arylsulfatase [Saprospiraceae bacterium]